jgi:hypothetical protein
VRGRGAHIATALTNLGWSKGPAVTILAKCEDGQVKGSRYEAIGSLKGVEIPLRNSFWKCLLYMTEKLV